VGQDAKRFERVVMPHLDAAYNLARWLTRRPEDAEDVLQEAILRAFRYQDACRDDSARQWLLRIVRNSAYDWLSANRQNKPALFSELSETDENFIDHVAGDGESPEEAMIRSADRDIIDAMIAELPEVYREIIVLRELEEMSYKEIGEICAIPIGTVMSRLKRGRDLLMAMGRQRRDQA
jgi:RNA polymerase sigma-70 factor (ECF subfamily)